MFSLHSLKSLKPFIWPNRKWILFSLLMAIPLSALRIGPIPLVKYLIDEILNNKNESKLILIPLGVIGMYTLNLVVRFLHYYSTRIVVIAANRLIKEKLYNHLISLSYDYYSEQKTGSLLSRVTADPAQLDQGIASLNVLIREPITFTALLSYVLYTNWKLTLMTFSIVPLLGLVFSKTGRYVKTKIAEYQRLNGEHYSIIQESISGIRVIHLYALRKFMEKKFADQSLEMQRMLLKISKIEELASPMVELVTSFAIALILYSGGKAVLNGEMTSGDLIAFFAAFGMMVNPIRQLSDINTKIHSAAGAMDRINHFLSWKSNVSDIEKAKHPTLHQGIELRNVSFTYPNSFDRLVLKNVSFNVPSGKTIALVGQSGSGKSSIAQLLTRMYDVNNTGADSGIFIDGIDLRHLKIEEWRNQVAVVSQDVFLFHDTIYNNIALGNPNASREEVIQAAQKAFAHDFIQRLSEGYETIVGDRGMKLSGGERQRISIARAFLRNSNLLILDEATSNLDLESEKIVQTTLETLMKGKTTVVIAHRLSTIRNADQIIVIREGEKIESGTYSELMDIRGEFYRLCQFSG
jgi:subfamily B ATP-binding cassette protein MsbA